MSEREVRSVEVLNEVQSGRRTVSETCSGRSGALPFDLSKARSIWGVTMLSESFALRTRDITSGMPGSGAIASGVGDSLRT